MRSVVVGRYLVFAMIFAAVSVVDAGEVLDLGGSGWRVWRDVSAPWSGDTLYLPHQVDLPSMPVHPPTVGWDAMFASYGTPVELPATVEEVFSAGVNGWVYHGVSWFYRDVDVPAAWEGKVVRLQFDSTRLRAELYVNHVLSGYDLVAETPWEADVSSALVYGATNRIAVRITNPGSGSLAQGGRGWEDTYWVAWGEYLIPASHDFAGVGGGVRLVATDRLYVDDVFVRNELPAGARAIDVRTTIRSQLAAAVDSRLDIEIADAATGEVLHRDSRDGLHVAAGATVEVSIPAIVPAALLWSVEEPHLYVARAHVSADGLGDTRSVRFGFRTFEVKVVDGRHGFFFNGTRLRHRSAIDWGYYALRGPYATEESARRSVATAKAIGQNGINAHRKIGEPRVMDAADELGLLVSEEPGGFHTGEQGYAIADGTFAAGFMAEKVRRMARRDRNHPSLVIYVLGNEDNGWNAVRQRAMLAVRDLDGTRAVVNSSGWSGLDCWFNDPCPFNHIRPYESAIRTDWHDQHTVSSKGRFDEAHITTEHETVDETRIKYWGEAADYCGPANWYLVAESQASLPDGRPGYDVNIYQGLHDKILDAFSRFRLASTGTRRIRGPEDVSRQAGRGLMYSGGRSAQKILARDATDGYALNGWSGGPDLPDKWHSSLTDEGRNLKGPAEDFAWWVRAPQIAIFRQNGKYFAPGAAPTFDVHLIHEGRIEPGTYQFRLSVLDGAGTDTGYLWQTDVVVTGGETYVQDIVRDHAITLSGAWKGGYLTIEGRLLRDGVELAYGAEQILLANRPTFHSDIAPYSGAVYNWGAAQDALAAAGVSVPGFRKTLSRRDYVVAGAGGAGTQNDLTELLRRVRDEGTALIVHFDAAWASQLFNAGVLSEAITTWGGDQTTEAQQNSWKGNGWAYLDYVIGPRPVPSGPTIGTNSWEVPEDPVGFWPFASSWPIRAYGLYMAHPEVMLVILGEIDYGAGRIVLSPAYPVDRNNALTDLLFYNTIHYAVATDDDADGAPDVSDCAPLDPTASVVPAEVAGVGFEADKSTLRWDSLAGQAGASVLYDVLEGRTAELPVGSGASETCPTRATGSTSTVVTGIPVPGEGAWFLVRGRNACGPGTYGRDSAGAERYSTACP